MDVRTKQHQGWEDVQVRYGLKVLLRMKGVLRMGQDECPDQRSHLMELTEECPDQQSYKIC